MSSQIELKTVSHFVSSPRVCDRTGDLLLLNGVAPGVAFNQRVGRQIRVKRIVGRFVLAVDSTTGVDQTARLAIVRDRQANASALSVLNVWDNTTPTSMPNLDNTMRFEVLWERVVTLNATAEAGSHREVALDMPCDIPVHYNTGTAGTIADIVTNSLYLISVGSEAAGSTAGEYTGNVRVFFADA